ncbi:3-hydroxyacyl-CoA dehydrogenase family protein [Streptomyces sp. NRRL F-5126]|uniref:3-hydroxyacyl-CoA dehydrogenase family protein n=1 Tax=Streptomyces sp. NRRL F-5126 TaxID=1463857 RepID=UPI00068CF6FC|nr:3-hydroxyacyl-CoA dehydrogenase NAD-binding domain-containing protein [Streptomyces sp. NRRL F-5126]
MIDTTEQRDGATAQDPRTVAVVGLGGHGLALARRLARAGLDVIGVDHDPAAVARAMEPRGSEHLRAVARFPDGISGADLVIEAVPEPPALKRVVLAEVNRRRTPGTPVLTTALTTPLAELADVAGPGLFALRFLSSDSLDGAELAAAPDAAPAQAERVAEILGEAGIAVHPSADRPGSYAPGLLLGLLNRAAWMVHDGYASAQDVDDAMRLGCGWHEGPLAVLDAMGLDTARDVLSRLADAGEGHVAPAPVLDELIAQGALGRKTGRGFHRHDGRTGPRPTVAPTAAPGRRVAVVGSGVMATGIAEAFVRGGFDTTLLARTGEKARAAAERVEAALTRADDGRTGAAFTATTRRSVLGAVDIVVEAVVEDLDVKRRLFAELGEVCAPHTLLATSTSSLPVAACTEPAGRPGDVLGLHFFNPAPMMRLVELVPAGGTSAHTLARARAVARYLGKRAVQCGDRAGFIANALLFPYLNQALELLDAGGTTTAALDASVRSVGEQPLGPVRLLDMVGADVALEVMRRLHADPRCRAPRPAGLLERLVAAGHLGRKTPGRNTRTYLAAHAALPAPLPAAI